MEWMMIVAKIDTRGFTGHLHAGAGRSYPPDFHFFHHLNGHKGAIIRVDLQEEDLVVVGVDNGEGGDGSVFLTVEQARDLLDKLATALAGEPEETEWVGANEDGTVDIETATEPSEVVQ